MACVALLSQNSSRGTEESHEVSIRICGARQETRTECLSNMSVSASTTSAVVFPVMRLTYISEATGSNLE
jgi:hypothetical protein